MNKTPVMIHVPKTGGSSLRLVLGAQPRHYPASGPMIRKRYRRATNPYLFAFLRCPLDRAVSAYYFARYHKHHRRQGTAALSGVLNLIDLNQFYEGASLEVVHEHAIHFRRQVWFVRKAPGPVHYYDFGSYRDEVDRVCRDLGRAPPPEVKHVYKTERPGTDALSPASVSRIKKFYAADFRLMDAQGFPHGG